MQWSTLMQLAREGCSSTLTFLSDLTDADDIGPYIVGMGNSNGGKIIIGIDVKNFHLLGTFIDKNWVDKLINEHCYPFVPFTFDVINRSEKRIVCITINESAHKPFYFKKKCYVMDKSEPQLVLEEDEKRLHPSPHNQTPQHINRLSVVESSLAQAQHQIETQEETLQTSAEDSQQLNQVSFETPTPTRTEGENQVPFVPLSTATTPQENSVSTKKEDENDFQTQFQTQINIEETQEPTIDPRIVKIQTQTPTQIETGTETKTGIQGSVQFHSDAQQMVIDSTGAHTEPGVAAATGPQTEIESPIQKINADHAHFSLVTNKEPEKELSARQKKVIKFLKRHETIKNKEYRELYKVSHKTAHLELVDLMDRGILIQQGGGRSTCYLLANPDQY